MKTDKSRDCENIMTEIEILKMLRVLPAKEINVNEVETDRDQLNIVM